VSETEKLAADAAEAKRVADEAAAKLAAMLAQQQAELRAMLAAKEAEAKAIRESLRAIGEQENKPRTVVPVATKRRYADAAKARGEKDRASRRGCGDWLQKELQAETIRDGVFSLSDFLAICDCNGVAHDRWDRTRKGWEGRLRMSGSIALRARVGKAGVLRLPDGRETDVVTLAEEGDEAARAFLAKWAN